MGTLRSNRKSNPKEVVKIKLQRGDIKSMRSDSNVLVLKWTDKRDLYMISTKHNSEVVEQVLKGKIIKNPKVVINYNIGKTSIDFSDQMNSNYISLRRSSKWYQKVVLDGLLNKGVINPLVLFNKVTSSKLSATNFRALLVEQLVKKDIIPSVLPNNHELKVTGKIRFIKCYAKAFSNKGKKHAQSHVTKVQTKCIECNSYYCVNCFFKDHNCKKK